MQKSELFKLIGIVIVIAGFALRLRTTLVVLIAGVATGVAAGMPLFSRASGQTGIIDMLGKAFADNRLMTLFIITLPAIGLAERYGLQEQSAAIIRRVHAATTGRLLIVYQLFRILHGAMGIRLNGHPSFVRPLIYPMSIGSLKNNAGATENAVERIKAADAASENYGNFYGQNLSPVQAGILLVYGVMQGLGFTIGIWNLVFYTVPIVLASIVLGAFQFSLLDRWLSKQGEAKE